MSLTIARRRLTSQQLVTPTATTPADVVHQLVAVQAQEYASAKWALGQRAPETTDDDVERAFAEGEILRTHVLRPTWHFVAPADIRWLLALTGPRVHAANAYMYRKVGLDATVARRSRRVLVRALEGGHHRTRHELREALTRAGVATDGDMRVAYLLMHAELDGVICSGPRRGKQFTYALLEERVPPARTRSEDEALAELTSRYFTSRGPASVYDMAKWSGLTVTAVRRGVEAVRHTLLSEVVGDEALWFAHPPPMAPVRSQPVVHLLPIYDEYGSAYKDRSAMASEEANSRLAAAGASVFTHIITIDGKIVGGWKPRIERRAVTVSCELTRVLKPAEHRALRTAMRGYARFIGKPLTEGGPRPADDQTRVRRRA